MKKHTKKQKSQKVIKPFDLYFLFISTIFVIPLVYLGITTDPNLAPRLFVLGFIFGIFSLLSIAMLINKIPEFRFIKLIIFPVFLLYFVWMMISITQAVNWAEGLFDLIKTALSFLLLVFATQVFLNNKNAFSFLVKTVIVSSVIATAYGLYQYYEEVPGKSGYELITALYEVKGLMAHKNQFAISLLLMLPFTFYGMLRFRKWWQGLSIYATLLIIIIIVIMQSRSVWVATGFFIITLGVIWLWTFLRQEKRNIKGLGKIIAIVTIVFLLASSAAFWAFQKTEGYKIMKYRVSSLFDTKSHDNQGRLKMWESTWEMSQDNLLFGVGAGNWRISIVPYYQVKHGSRYQNWRRPHNDYLWILSEKGIIGLVLYLLLFIIITFYSFKILRSEVDKDKKLITILLSSGIVAYFIVALFSFPSERINHQIYLAIMMAGIISIYYKSPKNLKPISGKLYFGVQLLSIAVSVLAIFYSYTLIKSEANVQKLVKAMRANNQKAMIFYADKAFSKYTTVDHYSVPIHNYKGMANINMKKYKQANEDLQIALGYFPTHIAVLSNLAIVSAELNQNEKAKAYLMQSLKLYPNYDPGLYNLINFYYREKDYSQAYLTLLQCNTKNRRSNYNDYSRILKGLIDKSAN